MDITIVIPVDGRSDYLARSLETLLRQHALRSEILAEVIVVDNARTAQSRDATRCVCLRAAQRHSDTNAILNYVVAQHADVRHRNASYPLNVGIRLARAPVVLICAADILHVTPTVAQHVQRHRETNNLLLYSFCRDCLPSISLEPDILQRAVIDEGYALRMASHTDWYGGMCCSARTEALIAVGGFEESFTCWGYEDYDLARRLQLQGAEIMRDDAIQVLHQRHPTNYQGAWRMKVYAGIRQLLRIRTANRGRVWGQVRGDPETLSEGNEAHFKTAVMTGGNV